MARFVLIAGAWHGAWCWRRVLPLLRDAGHEAHPVPLTGVGERAHLLSGEVTLATHIKDVLSVVEHEELNDVVLVGHSYGGMVITGVADALLHKPEPALRHLVYVDAIVPHPGESWSSRQPTKVVEARIKLAETEGGRPVIPAPDASAFALEGEDRAWVNRRQTPHPFRTYQEPLDFDASRVTFLPRTYVVCTRPALAVIAAHHERARTEPGWRVRELAAGHDPMVSAPRALADILLDCAA